jgi:hypothetical protein
MKTKKELIFSVISLEGLLKAEGLYEDVLRIMDEYKTGIDFNQQFYLSTEEYYFKYRYDNNSEEIIRATLYNLKGDKVDDVRVSEGYGMPKKSHHDIINYFEARLQIGAIK